MALKYHNTLAIDCSLDGLPENWRTRVEEAIKLAGPHFSLYLSGVQAGARRQPPGVLVSISRDGAPDAWTPKCEAALVERVLKALDDARQEERAQRAAELHEAHRPWAVTADGAIKIRARQDVPGDDESGRRTAQRQVVLADLRIALGAAELPPEAADFAHIALQRMEAPLLWPLWARLLLAVFETELAVPVPLQERMVKLL